MSGVFFVFFGFFLTVTVIGCGGEARDAAKYSTLHRIASLTKNYPATALSVVHRWRNLL